MRRTDSRRAYPAKLRAILLFIAAIMACRPALADLPPVPDPGAALTPYQQDLVKSATIGPKSIKLRDQATLALPSGAAFIPEAPARALMQRFGNKTSDNLLGIIAPWEQSDWIITLEYFSTGYVSDDDAKNWNPDDLLKSIRDNTQQDNAYRREHGAPELDVLGWVEKPHYDNATHRLIWSVLVKRKGEPANAVGSINYRMYALGREGYLSLNMIANPATIEERKPIAAAMLSHVNFDGGKRYTDFNSTTDRVAEFGLAALIGGVVVKKLGLFALIAAFVIKGAKFLVVLAAGAVAAARRFFRGGKPAETAPSLLNASPAGDLRTPVLSPPADTPPPP